MFSGDRYRVEAHITTWSRDDSASGPRCCAVSSRQRLDDLYRRGQQGEADEGLPLITTMAEFAEVKDGLVEGQRVILYPADTIAGWGFLLG